MRCQQGNRGPDKPHDAHDAGLLGAAGASTSAAKASETLKIRAVGSMAAPVLHDQHANGSECIIQAKLCE